MNSQGIIKIDNSIIKDIQLGACGDDFTLKVNDNEYQTKKIIADILLPEVNNIHKEGQNINCFEIHTSNEGNFQPFIDLIQSGFYEIQDENLPFISEVLIKLNNPLIKTIIHEVPITPENIFELIAKHDKYSNIYKDHLVKDIDFLSNHFYLAQMNINNLCCLSVETITRIINNDKLLLESEDQLISIINLLVKNDACKYSFLYQFVNFIKIGSDKMNEFIKIFNCQNMTNEIWSQICYRLQQSIIQPTGTLNNAHNYGISHWLHENTQGIIHFIQTKGNINQLINIKSLSLHSNPYTPYNLVQYDETAFHSQNAPGQWVLFDFMNYKVILYSYQITTAHWPGFHPAYFVLECSNDISLEHNWVEIDRVSNCEDLNGEGKSKNFLIKNQDEEKAYRYIRLRQTGPTKNGHNYLIFRSIEFYGSLIETYNN